VVGLRLLQPVHDTGRTLRRCGGPRLPAALQRQRSQVMSGTQLIPPGVAATLAAKTAAQVLEVETQRPALSGSESGSPSLSQPGGASDSNRSTARRRTSSARISSARTGLPRQRAQSAAWDNGARIRLCLPALAAHVQHAHAAQRHAALLSRPSTWFVNHSHMRGSRHHRPAIIEACRMC